MRSPSPSVHFGTQFLEGSRVLCAVCCKPTVTLSLTDARRTDASRGGELACLLRGTGHALLRHHSALQCFTSARSPPAQTGCLLKGRQESGSSSCGMERPAKSSGTQHLLSSIQSPPKEIVSDIKPLLLLRFSKRSGQTLLGAWGQCALIYVSYCT